MIVDTRTDAYNLMQIDKDNNTAIVRAGGHISNGDYLIVNDTDGDASIIEVTEAIKTASDGAIGWYDCKVIFTGLTFSGEVPPEAIIKKARGE